MIHKVQHATNDSALSAVHSGSFFSAAPLPRPSINMAFPPAFPFFFLFFCAGPSPGGFHWLPFKDLWIPPGPFSPSGGAGWAPPIRSHSLDVSVIDSQAHPSFACLPSANTRQRYYDPALRPTSYARPVGIKPIMDAAGSWDYTQCALVLFCA